MITIDAVCQAVPGTSEATLLQWLEQAWVRAERERGEWRFLEIDVARVRLIAELAELEVETPTVPLVLSLLDQLYATRRQLRLVLENLDGPAREALLQRLTAADS